MILLHLINWKKIDEGIFQFQQLSICDPTMPHSLNPEESPYVPVKNSWHGSQTVHYLVASTQIYQPVGV